MSEAQDHAQNTDNELKKVFICKEHKLANCPECEEIYVNSSQQNETRSNLTDLVEDDTTEDSEDHSNACHGNHRPIPLPKIV